MSMALVSYFGLDSRLRGNDEHIFIIIPMHLTLQRTSFWWARGVGVRCGQPHQRYDIDASAAAYLLRTGRAILTLQKISDIGVSMYALSTTRLSVLTPPVTEPISLSEAKHFLRIDFDHDDLLILRSISVAREAAEHYLSVALLPQTLAYKLDDPQDSIVALPRGPVSAIASVTSTDENNNDTLWDASNYRASSDGFSVLLKQNPAAAILTIQYTASLAATPATLPALLLQGMLHHVAVLVDARDGSVAMPAMSVQCYQPFRRISL